MIIGGTLQALVRNVTRWNQEVSSGGARATLLSGIAGKAVDGFENLLRTHLTHFLATSSLTYETELAPDFLGKSPQKLTLGEVVQSLDKLGRRFSRVLGKDVLLRKGHKRRLTQITRLRNMLHHHFEEKFASDEATLTENTIRLLSLIQQELTEPFFMTAEKAQSAEING
jgi:hypothetical protein